MEHMKLWSLAVILGLLAICGGLYLEYVYEVPYFWLGGERESQEFKKNMKEAGIPIFVGGVIVVVVGVGKRLFFTKPKQDR